MHFAYALSLARDTYFSDKKNGTRSSFFDEASVYQESCDENTSVRVLPLNSGKFTGKPRTRDNYYR